nr:prepilin peptidase [Bacillus altitudinis]
MGSFFHLVGERLPMKRSILFPRSHCGACKEPLSFSRHAPAFFLYCIERVM